MQIEWKSNRRKRDKEEQRKVNNALPSTLLSAQPPLCTAGSSKGRKKLRTIYNTVIYLLDGKQYGAMIQAEESPKKNKKRYHAEKNITISLVERISYSRYNHCAASLHREGTLLCVL